MLLPYILYKVDKRKIKDEDKEEDDKKDEFELKKIGNLLILITLILFLCSSLMSAMTKRELMFP